MCPSAILMAALTLTFVLFDIYNNKRDYAIIHSVLGFLISFLFFVLCNYGFEIVNWIALSIIPGYILFSWLFSEKEESCDTCCESEAKPSCSTANKEISNEKNLSCPARPMRLGTQCGISRFT